MPPRPVHVDLNVACSLEGRVAGPGGRPVELSGPADWERVHRLRADSDAVVVGIGTVLADDPRLTARPEPRPPPAEQPLRVVVDSRARVPEDARVLSEAAPTLVLAAEDGRVEGAEVLAVPREGRVDLAAGLEALADRGVERVLVEGGPTLAGALLREGLVDRVLVYVAPRILPAGPSLAEAWSGLELRLEPRDRRGLGEGTLLVYGVEP